MVLDEPTAVLSEADSEHLLGRLEGFRKEGKAILYVTHRLSEVMRLADRITILRDGKRVGHFKRGEISRGEIVTLMAKDGPRNEETRGVELSALATPPGEAVISVRGLSAPAKFNSIDLDVREHEIIGIAGVQGSGHGQLLRRLQESIRFRPARFASTVRASRLVRLRLLLPEAFFWFPRTAAARPSCRGNRYGRTFS
jgi:ABC-type sugar transport system ATPase subunit